MDELKKLQETIEKFMAKIAESEEAQKKAVAEVETKSAENAAEAAKKAVELETAIKGYNDSIADLKKRIEEIEMDAKAPKTGEKGSEITFGEYIAKSEEYKRVAGTRTDITVTFEVDEKTVSNSTEKSFNTTNMSDLLTPLQDRRPTPVEMPREMRRITDATGVKVWTGGGNTVYWNELTSYWPLATTLTVAAAPGDSSATFTNVSGMEAGQTIYFVESGFTTKSVTIDAGGVNPTTKVVTFTGTIGGAHTFTIAGTLVASDKLVGTLEEAEKPELMFDYTPRNTTFVKYPITGNFSKELVEDVPSFQRELNRHLQYAVASGVDRAQLLGVESTTSIQGIITATGIQTRNWSDGDAGDTVYDAIGDAIDDISDAFVSANLILMNPTNLRQIKKLKDTTGQYIVRAENGLLTLHGVRVMPHSFVPVGTVLIGDFSGENIEFWRKGGVGFELGRNGDDFKKNRYTAIFEVRCLQMVTRPQAFCVLTLDGEPVVTP
jgi:hypothetical protein